MNYCAPEGLENARQLDLTTATRRKTSKSAAAPMTTSVNQFYGDGRDRRSRNTRDRREINRSGPFQRPRSASFRCGSRRGDASSTFASLVRSPSSPFCPDFLHFLSFCFFERSAALNIGSAWNSPQERGFRSGHVRIPRGYQPRFHYDRYTVRLGRLSGGLNIPRLFIM